MKQNEKRDGGDGEDDEHHDDDDEDTSSGDRPEGSKPTGWAHNVPRGDQAMPSKRKKVAVRSFHLPSRLDDVCDGEDVAM